MAVLKQVVAGRSVLDLWRARAIINATVNKWRAKFGGRDFSLMAKMKDLEDKSWHLKKLYVDTQTRALIVGQPSQKNSFAITATGDGYRNSGAIRRARLSGMCCLPHLRDLLLLSSQTAGRGRRDCLLVGAPVRQQSEPGLWVVLPGLTQRQRQALEPQVVELDLLRARIESADQAQEADGVREAGRTGRAGVDQSSLVDGLHA